MTPERPILFDLTRMVALGWTGKRQTGIDRVCAAYLHHFAPRAQAMVQYRGLFRVFDAHLSDDLFALLADPDQASRRSLLARIPAALARSTPGVRGKGMVYLNVSHTDFDLPQHTRWAQACGLKPVHLIHDLIPIHHPNHCRPHAVRRHLGRVLNSLRTASGIIVNSRATAHDLAGFAARQQLRLPPVLTAHLAGAPLSPSGHPAPEKRPYFLCVGTIESRKNHIMLLRIWQKLAAKEELAGSGTVIPRLVLIGQWGAYSEPVRDLLRRDPRLARHVTVLDHCHDAQMADWIRSARAVLLPTRAEGFGLPLVEAMALGTPVIASDLPCFREIGQGIPLLLPPDDQAAWEAAITTQAAATLERQHRLLPGFRKPTWADHFVQVDHWLEETVLGGHKVSEPRQAQAGHVHTPPAPAFASAKSGLIPESVS